MRADRWIARLLKLLVPSVLVLVVVVEEAAAEKPVFKYALDGQAIDVRLKAGEIETPALREFKETGTNVYRNDPSAVRAGKALYDQWCQVCHNSDASGKLAPPLIGGRYIYPQTATDAGMFAIIYGGASGAMQPFSRQNLSQDDMLKIVAYIRSLDRKKK